MKFLKILHVLIKFSIALFISYCLRFINKKRELTLIGTRNGNRGNDNAEYFLEYLKANKIEAKIIYNCICEDKNELQKNSLMCIVGILNAKELYITHSESDLLDYWWKLIPKLKVSFIQHGVIGIKSLPDYERKKFSAFVVSNAYEEKIILRKFSCSKENIIRSGIPRFDYYDVVQPYTSTDQITDCLVMLTWRNDKNARLEQIIQYQVVLDALTRSSSVLNIKLCVHDANKTQIIQDISSLSDRYRNVQLIDNEQLPDAIRTIPLLITDYSSVAWDFLYQNKLILFYTYDISSYRKETGLYCDFNDFFGAQLKSIDIHKYNLLSWIIEENLRNNSRFLKLYPFYYHGKKIHSDRMYDAIRSTRGQ